MFTLVVLISFKHVTFWRNCWSYLEQDFVVHSDEETNTLLCIYLQTSIFTTCYTRQAMHIKHNTDVRSCKNCCCGRAVSVTYSECVSVALVIHCPKTHVPYYTVNRGLFWLYYVLPHYLITGRSFGKKVNGNNTCVLVLSKTFDEIQLNMHTVWHNYIIFYCYSTVGYKFRLQRTIIRQIFTKNLKMPVHIAQWHQFYGITFIAINSLYNYYQPLDMLSAVSCVEVL